jgi:hypothetical protein
MIIFISISISNLIVHIKTFYFYGENEIGIYEFKFNSGELSSEFRTAQYQNIKQKMLLRK